MFSYIHMYMTVQLLTLTDEEVDFLGEATMFKGTMFL